MAWTMKCPRASGTAVGGSQAIQPTMSTERYFIDAYGPDDDALRDGLKWLLHYADEHGHDRAAVFVPTLRQAESLGRVLGREAAKRLKRDREVAIDHLTLELLIASNLGARCSDAPLLAVWVDDKQLDKLDGLAPPAICVVPWLKDDIEGWKDSWNPGDARTGESGDRRSTVTNTVVVAALESLTGRVNLSTGLSHPYDKAAAVSLFQFLLGAGEQFEPGQVRAWAVRNGWHPDDARELGDVAQKLKDGRRVQNRYGQRWAEDIVDQWRAEADKT